MGKLVAYLIAGLIVIAAGAILYRRIRDFVRTKGKSACENCPYSGSCGGSCDTKPGGGGCH